MLQLSITPLPSGRALVSVFVPEHTVEGFQLGTLFEDLGWLEPFGCSGATITECKLYVFVSAKVGSESSKFAGTSIGQLQQMSDILGMGVTSIAVSVRPREAVTVRRRSLLDALVRAPVATFPDWGGGGKTAYGVLYAAMKEKLVLLFTDHEAEKVLNEQEIKACLEFMQKYVKPFQNTRMKRDVLSVLIRRSTVVELESDENPFSHNMD